MGSGRFLVVGADAAFLAEALRALEAVGASVVVARTPLSAVWALERTHFDAVVCGCADLRRELSAHWPSVVAIASHELPKDHGDLARWLETL